MTRISLARQVNPPGETSVGLMTAADGSQRRRDLQKLVHMSPPQAL